MHEGDLAAERRRQVLHDDASEGVDCGRRAPRRDGRTRRAPPSVQRPPPRTLRPVGGRAAPKQAALIASVAPLVNTTSRGPRAEQGGDLFAGLLERGAGHAAFGVHATRVACDVEPLEQCGARRRPQRRYRRVIEIGAAHAAAPLRRAT